jgi:hypothetical protein
MEQIQVWEFHVFEKSAGLKKSMNFGWQSILRKLLRVNVESDEK